MNVKRTVCSIAHISEWGTRSDWHNFNNVNNPPPTVNPRMKRGTLVGENTRFTPLDGRIRVRM